MLGLFALACGGSEPPDVSQAEAVAAAEALWEAADDRKEADQPAPEELKASPEAVPLVFVWQNISPLYKGFFSDAEATAALSHLLAGQVADPANIYVRYNNETMVGDIRLQLLPDTLSAQVTHKDDLVQLQGLATITVALASYRDLLAQKFDLRIQSFRIGVESYRGPLVCVFEVTGTPPPDGTVVSPCVELNGEKVCGSPGPDGTTFSSADAKKVRNCLDL